MLIVRVLSARLRRVVMPCSRRPWEQALGWEADSRKAISPGNRPCQKYGVVVGPALTEERLLGASLQLIVGWPDSYEKHVPLDMFAGGGGAPAREGLIQQYEVSHFIDLR